MTSFLRTLIIIISIILLLRFVTRVFMPYVLRYLMKKSEEQINKKFNEFNQQNNKNSYDTTNQTNNVKPKEKKKVGEYIDFEEID
ncbi:DUF4834 family protein [Neptunitalea lumnitzerae]